MQTHVATTPFGRRPMTLGLVASQVVAKEMAQDAEVDKWQTCQDIRDAKELIGATDRALAILSALLSFHPDKKTLSAQENLIVWPSNEALRVRANGMSLATLQRHIANLVTCGLVIRRDSPNGKRFARKGQGGSIAQAYGFDLSPIVARAGEFKDLADAVRAEKHAYKLVRERLTICRRDVVKLIVTGSEEGVPGDWTGFRARYDRLLDDLPRAATRQTLESVVAELEKMRSEISNVLESFIKSQNLKPNALHSETHIQNSNPDSNYEIEQGFRKKNEARCNVAEADNVRSLPRRELPLGIVLEACREIRWLISGGEIRTWRDLVVAAGTARISLGVSPSAWEEAQAVLGPENAAITVAAIYERAKEIASPGGYLRNLTDRAKDGKFSPWPMVMARLRARTSVPMASAETNVVEKPSHLEVSDALKRSMTTKRWNR
ncbi:MAG: plasmid replication protein RepC [Sphingobium sp.]